MNEILYEDIRQQPEAVRQNLSSFRRQLTSIAIPRKWKRLVIAGSGDSWSAANSLLSAATKYLGYQAIASPLFEVDHYMNLGHQDLLVIVSFSGETPQAAKLAEKARRADISTFAITANEGSSLGRNCDQVLRIDFKSRSRNIPHACDYLSTLLSIATLIEYLGDFKIDALDQLDRLVAENIASLEGPCLEVGKTLLENDHFFFLGAGPSWGIAQYGAAKLWESGGIRAFPIELDEIYHGPLSVVDPGDPTFLLVPEGKSVSQAQKIIKAFQSIGTKVFVVTDNRSLFPEMTTLEYTRIDEEWSPLLSCIPMQLLCWAITTCKGFDVELKDGRHPNREIYARAYRELSM